ncbi:MAG: amidase family protein, partial [Pseudomonadota bacterium]
MEFSRPNRTYTGPELCLMSACQVVTLLKAGDISPEELLKDASRRMDQVEPQVNATVIRDDERALMALNKLGDRQGKNGGHRGWLAGLPIGIKDLIAVAGMRGTAGSPALAHFIAEESDALIDRLEARGAIF